MNAHDESARPAHEQAADQQPHPGDVRSNEDLTEAAAEGLRWIAYSRIAIEMVLLGAMVVLARLIPPAAFGIYAIVRHRPGAGGDDADGGDRQRDRAAPHDRP